MVMTKRDSAPARRVAFPGIFLPVLAKTVMRRLLMGMGAQLLDVDFDAQSRGGRQVDPAVPERKRRSGDLAAQILEVDEVFGDSEIRDYRREMNGGGKPRQGAVVVVRRHYNRVRLRHRSDIEHRGDPADDTNVGIEMSAARL